MRKRALLFLGGGIDQEKCCPSAEVFYAFEDYPNNITGLISYSLGIGINNWHVNYAS